MRESLILIPGVLCAEELWREQVRGLADLAEPTVTMAHAEAETIPEIAAAILAAAPRRFALAGLSMGGYIAFEIMRQAPERVSRVALLDTSARPDTVEQAAARKDLLALAHAGRFGEVTAKLLPSFLHPDRAEDETLLAAMRKDAGRVGVAGFIRQQAAVMARIDSRPSLPAIRVPALVLVGRQDGRTPPHLSEEIAAAIPGARLVVIEEAGHLPTLERPAETNAALRAWLSGGLSFR